MKRFARILLAVLIVSSFTSHAFPQADPPSTFDLRDVDGQNYVTSVKNQQGGTCWTHGSMAAIEGNLLKTGIWATEGETGEPDLAEYHLDWWNGFNQNNNDDLEPPTGAGLVVHEGGDYRVTTAYLSRGEGAVRDIDGQSFVSPPLRYDSSYHYYYPRDVEWLTVGADLSNINAVKNKIMAEGVMGTCLCYDASFMVGYTHYQPPSDDTDPNHAVAIVGWDDSYSTQAPLPGAWLCKNSWGPSWGYDGYFWISYYDKHCGHHPEMGAVCFRNVEPMQYDKVYYHDYHGWRDTKIGCTEAFNVFTADDIERLEAVSFFTATDSVEYTVTIYDSFEDNLLKGKLSGTSGILNFSGFHTVNLDSAVSLNPGEKFYIYVSLSDGGHPYDKTSDVPVLLGAKYRVIVESAADTGQSYYFSGFGWEDLTDFDSTANFCIKGLATADPYLSIVPSAIPEYIAPGQATFIDVEIRDGREGYSWGTATLHYRFDDGLYLTSALTPMGGDLYQAMLSAGHCGQTAEFYISAQSDGGHTIYMPPTAPDDVYSAEVGIILITFEDNFEDNYGWTDTWQNATSGLWERGVPVNDPEWDYDPAYDGDGSGSCYLTGNATGNTDVDNGSVTLISPWINMIYGGFIEYDYYLYLTGTDEGIDKLVVEINNNGGSGDWIEIARHDQDHGTNWYHNLITHDEMIAAGVIFTAQMVIRFTANDGDPQSIVEAGIDGFKVGYVECIDPYICGDINNDEVINIFDITFLISYLYQGGPPPEYENSADINHDGNVNIFDITGLIDYLYRGGSEPNCP